MNPFSLLYRFISLAAGAALLVAAGCAVPGLIAYKVLGPESVKPQYVLPQQPLLVVCESYSNPGLGGSDGQTIARVVTETLKARKVVPVIDSAVYENFRSAHHEEIHDQSISDIGRGVGAGQVLYIDILQSQVEEQPGTAMYQGMLSVRARVVDVATGQTRWPVDAADGYPLSYKTPYIAPAAGVSPSSIHQKMDRTLGARIARLFYPYKPNEVEE